MSGHAYTEDQLVEQPAMQLFKELGWQTVSALEEAFSATGTLMLWHTMMEFVPPLVGSVVSNRNHTFEILRRTGECAINIPTVELAQKVVACGNASGRQMDKFKAFGFTPMAWKVVKAPLIAECYANLECKVVHRKLVAKFNFFILEAVKAWIDLRQKRPRTIHHQGEGVFLVPDRTLKLPSPKTFLLTT